MFDFNKRDASAKDNEFPPYDDPDMEASPGAAQAAAARPVAGGGHREAAIIGPSIHMNGDLRGEEDLVIEGEVKGTVTLKNNCLTIGSQGKVNADVYAHTIYVDGHMDGDLYGAERVSIRKTAEVSGNITSPRVSLEDGARFKGSIEMDPESEALKKAFADSRGSNTTAFPGNKPVGGKDSAAIDSSIGKTSDTPTGTPAASATAKGGSAG